MKYIRPIHIVAAKRSAIGRFGGSLKSLSAADIAFQVASQTVDAALASKLEGMIFGHVLQAGGGMNLARQVALRLGVPQISPSFVVNMVCGSGLKAVGLAADAIQGEEAQLLLAGGAESMSQAPYYAKDIRWGKRWGDSKLEDSLFSDGLTDPILKISMAETAERIADAYSISREEQDRYAAQSQMRAIENVSAFSQEIVGIRAADAIDLNRDEHPRADTTMEKLAALKSAFRKDGRVTAGNASGMNDGAAVVVLAGDGALNRLGLRSRARIVACATTGCDPAMMGLGPVGAIQKVCTQAGWDLSEVDLVEINEAFAVQTLACIRNLQLDETRVNVRGGAIALGHPIGCSGTRILVTLLHAMEDRGARRGIASLCIGGGMGIAMAIERT